MKKSIWFWLLVLILLSTGVIASWGGPMVRLKDIARLKGLDDNILRGYGLVIGLNKTGDSDRNRLTIQTVANTLKKLGITINEGAFKSRNVAAVIVTATLPPFKKSGDKIDVTISSIGDAESLSGGLLLQTELLGGNQHVYAIAQGPISLGGGAGDQRTTRNQHTTVGRIPNGATIINEVPTKFEFDDKVSYILNQADFKTASRVIRSINNKFGGNVASAPNPGLIDISIPANYKNNVVSFIADVEELSVEPDHQAKIVINERTGTVVMGDNVKISQTAVSHGNLSVTIRAEAAPGANIQNNLAVRSATITASNQKEKLVVLPDGASIKDVVKALNAVGATPRDIIAILQSLKSAGSLYADIELQ